MKTPKPGTYVLKSTHGKLIKKYKESLKEAWGVRFENSGTINALKEKYAKQSETLKDLSKEYNKLVEERKEAFKLVEEIEVELSKERKLYKDTEKELTYIRGQMASCLGENTVLIQENRELESEYTILSSALKGFNTKLFYWKRRYIKIRRKMFASWTALIFSIAIIIYLLIK